MQIHMFWRKRVVMKGKASDVRSEKAAMKNDNIGMKVGNEDILKILTPRFLFRLLQISCS